MRDSNPIGSKTTLSIEEQLKLHTDFLNKAISEKIITQQFYGYLFLFLDHYKLQNYVEATNNLLKAGILADSTSNLSWQAAIYMRKAAMADILTNSYEEEIEHYHAALSLCKKTKDSLCIGECLEQLGSSYNFLEQYDSAHYYYTLALPLLYKYADKQQMATTYNNYSLLLSNEKKYKESQQYFDSAINLARANNDTYKEMMYLNNLGSLYTKMGRYEKAIEIFKSCVPVNERRNYEDRLTQNYIGLCVAYEEKGDYRNAFEYLRTFYLLKDSLTGAKVQLRIADLNVKYDTQAKELALKNSELALVQARQRNIIRTIIILTLLLVVIVGFFMFHSRSRKRQQIINFNKERLLETKNILLEKNTLIKELEEKLGVYETIQDQEDDPTKPESISFNQRILTDLDWLAFKSQFENAYPNYLVRLRSTFSSLTESEEKLFVFLKLNFKNKESAAILGVSPESIKKTRNRLRKRIELPEDVNLDDFVASF